MNALDNKINILSDFKLDYNDLLGEVYINDFTLMDISRLIINSQIPIKTLCKILQCPYLIEYCDDIRCKPFSEEYSDIEYLELYWFGDKDKGENKLQAQMSSQWCFHGVGVETSVPQDVKDSYDSRDAIIPDRYREKYSVNLSPLYKLAGYPIKVSSQMKIADWTNDKNKLGMEYHEIDFIPSITLMDVFYWIFWELSFFGSVSEREARLKHLDHLVDNF